MRIKLERNEEKISIRLKLMLYFCCVRINDLYDTRKLEWIILKVANSIKNVYVISRLIPEVLCK